MTLPNWLSSLRPDFTVVRIHAKQTSRSTRLAQISSDWSVVAHGTLADTFFRIFHPIALARNHTGAILIEIAIFASRTQHIRPPWTSLASRMTHLETNHQILDSPILRSRITPSQWTRNPHSNITLRTIKLVCIDHKTVNRRPTTHIHRSPTAVILSVCLVVDFDQYLVSGSPVADIADAEPDDYFVVVWWQSSESFGDVVARCVLAWKLVITTGGWDGFAGRISRQVHWAGF